LHDDASGTLHLASRLSRLTAYLIDSALLFIVGSLVFVAVSGGDLVDTDEQEDHEATEVQEADQTGGADAEDDEEDDIPDEAQLIALIGSFAVALVIWPIFARHGQSPGKRLLGLYVHHPNGDVAPAWKILARFFWATPIFILAEAIPLAAGNTESELDGLQFVVALLVFLDGAWVLFHRDRRALHDLVLGTVAVQRKARVFGEPQRDDF